MDIDYTVAALMFPAIPLMMTMYSNVFILKRINSATT